MDDLGIALNDPNLTKPIMQIYLINDLKSYCGYSWKILRNRKG